MSPRFIHRSVIVGALLCVGVACSSDEDASSAPVTAPIEPTTTLGTTTTPPSNTVDPTLPLQEQVAELAILSLNSVNMGFDEQCVREVSLRYSDEDAAAIVAAGLEEQAVLSDQGNLVTDDLLACVGVDLSADMDTTDTSAPGN